MSRQTFWTHVPHRCGHVCLVLVYWTRRRVAGKAQDGPRLLGKGNGRQSVNAVGGRLHVP